MYPTYVVYGLYAIFTMLILQQDLVCLSSIPLNRPSTKPSKLQYFYPPKNFSSMFVIILTFSSRFTLLRCSVFKILTLSHLYNKKGMVGSSGLEPPTSRLSGVRSNHLSYEPM